MQYLIVFLSFFNTAHGQAVIPNPLPLIHTLPEFVKAILTIVVKVGLPTIAVLLVWTGFKFLTAQGDEKKLTEAKSALVWTVVGAAVLLGAWLFAGIIDATIKQLGS